MPTWRTPQLRRAVDSVLTQTHHDLRLVVVNDGDNPWPDLADITDPRLVRFDLEQNRGRYWADAVTLTACTTEWWTPHDADDVSEPNRYETQLATGAVVSFTSTTLHRLDGTVTTHPVRMRQPIAKYPAGVWRTEAARSIGIHPMCRAGFDTTFVLLTWQRFNPEPINTGLYHVHKRPESLTTSPTTGKGTPWRAAQRRQARDLLHRARTSTPDQWPRLMAPPRDAAAAFGADVQRLRALLA